jgi:hypothetical protein
MRPAAWDTALIPVPEHVPAQDTSLSPKGPGKMLQHCLVPDLHMKSAGRPKECGAAGPHTSPALGGVGTASRV